MTPLRYSPEIETVDPDEAKTIDGIIQGMTDQIRLDGCCCWIGAPERTGSKPPRPVSSCGRSGRLKAVHPLATQSRCFWAVSDAPRADVQPREVGRST